MSIGETETERRGVDGWTQRLGITRDSLLTIVFVYTIFAFLCVLITDDLNNECRDNKDPFRVDCLHGVGQLIADRPRRLGELALLLPFMKDLLTRPSLNFESGTQYLVPDGHLSQRSVCRPCFAFKWEPSKGTSRLELETEREGHQRASQQ